VAVSFTSGENRWVIEREGMAMQHAKIF